MKKLLVFQTAYTYQDMIDKSLEIYFTAKDLRGYFSNVVTVNPLAMYTNALNGEQYYGKSRIIIYNSTHTFIEGSYARFQKLGKLKKINFLLAQLSLIGTILSVIGLSRFDYVRAEDPRFSGMWGFLFSRILRRPFLVGVWGNPDTNRSLLSGPMVSTVFYNIRIEKRVEKFILNSADISMAQNQDNLDFILRQGVPIDRTRIFKLGNGIQDCHFVDPKDRDSSLLDEININFKADKIVIAIGQLEKRKIYEDSLKVAAILANDIDIQFIIVGEGSERRTYEQLAVKLGIATKVQFIGNISQPQLASLLSRADLVLSPLTGRALTEALLAAAPVVAYDIDCHPELIKSGNTGELVEFRNYSEMAKAAKKILDNPKYGAKLGQNGREFVLDFMDPIKINSDQIKAYETL
jgi:glycosyltransferase involved in cell wall biosynthesis